MSKKGKIVMWVIIAVLAVAVVAIVLSTMLNSGSPVTWDVFEGYVDNYVRVVETDSNGKPVTNDDGTVTVYVLDSEGNLTSDTENIDADTIIYSIVYDTYNYTGYSAGSKTYTTTGPNLYSYSELNVIWKSYGITTEYSDPNSGSYLSSIMSFVMIIVLCVIFWLIIRSAEGGGAKGNSFARSKARVSTNIKVRFTDVAGAEEEKLELAEVVEFLKQPKKFSDLGARIPKGVLLVGPPGTGKTLFAKAVAGEAGVPFFSVSGSDFVEMYVGIGASRVRDLFDMAKKNQPCIIFIDEIDAVGRHRGAGLGGGNDEREQTLNQILVQMDGFESNEGVIVMAATNRSDILDPALTRPGRFDRQIYVNLPDVKGREQILKVHARNKPLAPDVNFKTIARITSGFSGADLANLLNEAAILAARANKKFIGNAELYEGVNKVLMGPQKKSHIVTESDKRITAYHEAGHAIVARKCKHCDPVQEVSIIPRGNAAGYTMTRPDNDDSHVSREKLKDFICMALGGRAAEELVIKDITTGASNDLERVTETAKKMVTEWGMSEKLGLVTYGSNSQTVFLGKDMETHNAYSEETARLIDEEMHSIINEEHDRAMSILTEYRSALDNMARVLIEKETIYSEEVDMLMEGKSYTEVMKYMDEQDSANMENPFKRYGE
ncbi:MAG: ATP-dependent zinc metalloprotease FtsH [Clostridia bacterium]|nr:ATP-dependent zinc metalloprotease FtsH [Clostridia bacterium]